MIDDVPTLAIDIVTVHENSSASSDIDIALRLGLVPIHSDMVDAYKTTDECQCGGGGGDGGDGGRLSNPKDSACRECSCLFSIDVCNSGGTERRAVTSHDLKKTSIGISAAMAAADHSKDIISNSSSNTSIGGRPRRRRIPLPVGYDDPDDGILISHLAPGESLRLDCIATKATGHLHTKWSPVCQSTFKPDPIVSIADPDAELMLTNKQRQEIVAACPVGVFSVRKRTIAAAAVGGAGALLNNDEATTILDVEDASRCTFCLSCDMLSAKMGAPHLVRIDKSASMFRFTVESTGSLDPVDVLRSALRRIQQRLVNLHGGVAALI